MITEFDSKYAINKIRQMVIDKLEMVGELVERDAKLLCPTDLENLKESINHEVDENDLSVTIGTPVEYAPYLEFGTGERAENGEGRKGGWFFKSSREKLSGDWKPIYKSKSGYYIYFTYGTYPQPFLRPAVNNNKKEIKDLLKI